MRERVWTVSCILLAWTAAGCAESRPLPVPPPVEELMLTSDGSPIDSTSFYPPQVSRDGRIVAFPTSADNNLAPDCTWCIHVFDRDAAGPANSCPDLPRATALEWRLSEDGRYVLDWTPTGLRRVDWRTCTVELLPRGAGRSEGSVAILPDGSGFVWFSRRMAVVTFDGGDVERIESGPWPTGGAATIVPARGGRAFLLGFRGLDSFENVLVDFDAGTRFAALPASWGAHLDAPLHISAGEVSGFFADDSRSLWMVRPPPTSSDITDLEQFERDDLTPTSRFAGEFRWNPQFMRPLDDGRIVYACDIEPEPDTLPAACILSSDGTTGPVRAAIEDPAGLLFAAVAPASHELIFLSGAGSLYRQRLYVVSLDGY